MQLTRRGALALTGGVAAVTLVPIRLPLASLDSPEMAEALAEFTGGAEIGEGGLEISAPEIAENGNTVPITVSAEGGTDIMILAPDNPLPKIGTFHFSEMATPEATTRIRLAQTQSLVAIAKRSDGSFVQAAREIKVTIGGCGG